MEELYKDLILSLKRKLVHTRIASAVLIACLVASLIAHIFQ